MQSMWLLSLFFHYIYNNNKKITKKKMNKIFHIELCLAVCIAIRSFFSASMWERNKFNRRKCDVKTLVSSVLNKMSAIFVSLCQESRINGTVDCLRLFGCISIEMAIWNSHTAYFTWRTTETGPYICHCKKKTPTGHLYLLLFFICALNKGELNVEIHANECKGINFKTFKQFIYFLRWCFFLSA